MKANKPRLWVDCDGVLIDSIRAAVGVYDQLYFSHPEYKPVDYTTVKTWNMSELPLLKEGVDVLFDHPNFFRIWGDPMRNAYEVLEKLSMKYDITAISIGTPRNIAHKILWIEQEFPMIQSHIMLNNGGVMDKSIIRMNPEDVIIDDRLDVVSTCSAGTCIVFGQKFEWNEDYDNYVANNVEPIARTFHRALNWKEVEKILC